MGKHSAKHKNNLIGWSAVGLTLIGAAAYDNLNTISPEPLTSTTKPFAYEETIQTNDNLIGPQPAGPQGENFPDLELPDSVSEGNPACEGYDVCVLPTPGRTINGEGTTSITKDYRNLDQSESPGTTMDDEINHRAERLAEEMVEGGA